MSIEHKIFKKFTPDFKKIVEYGFKKYKDGYLIEKLFKNGEFRAVVKILDSGEVRGVVYEVESGEEFLPLRVEFNQGAFVGQIREEYENILKDIRRNCFNEKIFLYSQANRVANFVLEKYGDEPKFLWDKFPVCGVFRNPENAKWYGLIANIDRSKLDKTQKGEIEVMNIKLEEGKIQELLSEKSFYPAWHMNKKTWITVVLDETVADKTVFELLDESHRLTQKK